MDSERFKNFPKREQIGAVAAEIMRAKVWEGSDNEKFKAALERALQLVDVMLDDLRWKEELLMLLSLREELTKFYLGQQTNIETLYAAI